MTQIRAFFAGLVAALLVASMPASAAETQPYSPEALAEAQTAGKPILVDVYAAWCSTCRTQKPILAALTAQPKYKNLLLLRADFDKDKEVLKELGVRSQSTLIVFKGDQELVRSVGSTNAVAIEGLLDLTL
ncbi:MAG: thioredoxin family protein [Rhodospirillales bacterium]|nr:thioredoxin family protein [Rhodospirillales bacterium]